MHLFQSSGDPLNSIYTTKEGVAIYRVMTPFTLDTSLTSTIERAIPNVNPDKPGPDTFGYLATIVHSTLDPARIRYQGQEFSVDQFFTKGSMGWDGVGSRRYFTGPDGNQYYWKFGDKSELFLNDGRKTLVAKGHRKHYGIFSSKRPGSLEILHAGQHMMDIILITFIYIENLRAEREEFGA